MTTGLMALAGLIERSLEDLAGRPFDRVSAAQIVELLGRLTRGLLPHTGETWQQSFVSKYLHFHCDIAPIYDAKAEHAIGGFVDRRGPAVRAARASLPGAPPSALACRSFVAAFIVLRERISTETSIAASVRETDHLLWGLHLILLANPGRGLDVTGQQARSLHPQKTPAKPPARWGPLGPGTAHAGAVPGRSRPHAWLMAPWKDHRAREAERYTPSSHKLGAFFSSAGKGYYRFRRAGHAATRGGK